MERRDFIKAAVAGTAAFTAAPANAAESHAAGNPPRGEVAMDLRLAPPCGLYCGICHDDGCHGCGCTCGKCPGRAHQKACSIAACAGQRKVESCADCAEFACTKLIEFAYDPIWRTHGTALDNLCRRKAIGTARWLQEQQEYWADPKHPQVWKAMRAVCERQYQEFKTKGTL